MKIGSRLIDIRLRRIFFRKKFFGPSRSYPCEIECSARAGEISVGLVDGGLKDNGINLSDDLPSLHRPVKINKKLLNISRALTSNLDVLDRIQCTGRSDGLGNWAASNGNSLKATT